MQLKNHSAILPVLLAVITSCADQGEEPLSFKPQTIELAANTLQLVNVTGVQSNSKFVLIDQNGGVIHDELNGHELIIPAAAVEAPTWFTMSTLAVDKVVVELVAYRAEDFAPVTRFPKDLTLRLSITNAQVSSPDRLKIVYVSASQLSILEVFHTVISESGVHVEARIDHFSNYSMAMD